MRAYFGLGSNLENSLGQPLDHLKFALSELSKLGTVNASSVYASKPLGPQDQPDFLNAVCEVSLTQSHAKAFQADPHTLLDLTQRLETKRQRVKLRHWGERSLDVDVLHVEGVRANTELLTLPHPGVFERSFVWLPLLEVAPKLSVSAKPVEHWCTQHFGTSNLTRLLAAQPDLTLHTQQW